MDDLDRALVTLLTDGVPLQARPFRTLGDRLGIDEAEVLLRISRLRDERVIGKLGAVIDARKIGYRSTLVAMKFSKDRLEEGIRIIHDQPAVNYCCERQHDINLWFTVVSPAKYPVEDCVHHLHRISGSEKTLMMPVLKRYKSDSEQRWNFFREVGKEENLQASRQEYIQEESLLNGEEKAIIQDLQQGFLLTDTPFRRLAGRLGMPEAKILGMVRSLIQRGYLKKIGAFLNRKKSDEAKVLTVWQIPEEKQDEIGNKISMVREVGQCTARPSYAEFPYTLYVMIEGKDSFACEMVSREIEKKIGKWPRLTLALRKEFKKSYVPYFSEELDLWWDKMQKEEPWDEKRRNPLRLQVITKS
ncbi:MAG: AsnC family transcriptional regulator [Candidatus Omnitrophica bacterium]|nr:AsnC family transcriptional regulator [Candidatus Omnitrophota bacterium]